MKLHALLKDLSAFPWRNTWAVLLERFREDRLGLTASSLTFTTTMALVPFFTVALALFTAFPIFAKLQGALQTWLIESLIPEAIARQVMGYLTQFSGKASRLGVVSLAAFLGIALVLILTIDRTLNGLWRVKTQRPLARRVLIYWAAITLGPLLLGASLTLSSYVISMSRGLVNNTPDIVNYVLNGLEFFLLAGGLMALYAYVPNTYVRPRHALAGAIFAAVGIELAKKVLALYVKMVPAYSVVYGAFATLPILLLWIFVVWVIVLWGAVVAAYLPSLTMGIARRGGTHGWQFQLSVEVLQQLHNARKEEHKGLSLAELARVMQVDTLQLEPVIETLTGLDWVAQLNEMEKDEHWRYVLLADPETTELEPLLRQLLLAKSDAIEGFWQQGRLSSMRLADIL